MRGVLGKGEQAPGVAVPHRAAPGHVLQDPVLDDLWMERSAAQHTLRPAHTHKHTHTEHSLFETH